ncbi:MAG: FAD-dependent monooxygenase, partial [Rhodospirillales bacterium]
MFADRYTVAHKVYPYERSTDQDKADAIRHPVVVVGAGPVGMATALDLGQQGIPVLVLDDHEGIGTGSRAICFAKRCLEIADRYGCGEPMLNKGVAWNLGKVFHRDAKVFEFNLLPEQGHKYPAFINLQQPCFERFMIERLRVLQAEGAPIQLRGKNRVDAVEVRDDHVSLDVMTPDGPYRVEADWVVACDGANSPLRTMLGYGFTGKVFQDSFLIADIKLKGDLEFPTER